MLVYLLIYFVGGVMSKEGFTIFYYTGLKDGW
jgi:hypothetical protein